MPLFVCTCGNVENTALGDYWNPQLEGKPGRCSECVSGEWHGQFPKRKGTRDYIAGRGAHHFVDGTRPWEPPP